MKNLLVVLFAAVCLAVPGVMMAEVPEGDHISHVADDGSYRDNDRRVWVDACGDEHPLCPVIEPCPEAEECPEPAPMEPCEDEIVLVCNADVNYDALYDLDDKLEAILAALGDPEIEEYNQWSVALVGGANSSERSTGLQARWNWFGLRYMDYNLDGFYTQSELIAAGIDDPALPGSTYQDLGDFSTGDAESLSLMAYLTVYDLAGQGCLKSNNKIKLACRFSGYVSGGLYREEQINVSWNTANGGFRLGETNDVYKGVAGGGIDYSIPLVGNHGLTVGVGGTSQDGAIYSIGYSFLSGKRGN